jgi:hypothetical protein
MPWASIALFLGGIHATHHPQLEVELIGVYVRVSYFVFWFCFGIN